MNSGAFIFAALTYPLWGSVLLLGFCLGLTRLFRHGASRPAKILVISSLATLLFTPVVYGTEGFASFAHWSALLIDPRHSTFFWAFVAVTFVASALVTLALTGGKKRP